MTDVLFAIGDGVVALFVGGLLLAPLVYGVFYFWVGRARDAEDEAKK